MKDGFIRKTIKIASRLRYRIDAGLTRKIKSVRGEQFYYLAGACRSCCKCCQTPLIQVYPLLFF